MEDKKLRPKPIIVEVPEELVGQEIVFRLRKGGRTINFGTVKSVTPKDDGVILQFDPNKPGIGKLIGTEKDKKGD